MLNSVATIAAITVVNRMGIISILNTITTNTIIPGIVPVGLWTAAARVRRFIPVGPSMPLRRPSTAESSQCGARRVRPFRAQHPASPPLGE
eukprot:8066670-Pyramimonas_sp.AAC.1